MTQPQIRMKGTRKGLAITLEEGEWPDFMRELDTRLGQASAFFRGSQVHLATGKRDISQEQLQQFVDLLSKHEVQLASLRTSSEISALVAQALGVRLALPEVSEDQAGIRAPVEEMSEGLLVRRTLRSGQVLQHLGQLRAVADIAVVLVGSAIHRDPQQVESDVDELAGVLLGKGRAVGDQFGAAAQLLHARDPLDSGRVKQRLA